MEELLPFLQKFEIWIYILLGAVALIPIQQLISAWRVWQESVFGLEREIAQRRFTTALTVLVLLVILIFLEFFIVSFVAPGYPKVYAAATPTIDLLATPTVTLPVAAQAITSEGLSGGPGVVNTLAGATGLPSGAATPAGTAQAAQEGCTAGQIDWSFPKAGQEISATVELKGTVNVPNLGFYKYEFSKLGDDHWTTIAAGNQPKVDGQIGFWNTGVLDQGDYRLRLVVADNQNNLFPACVITVRIITP
jgi:hypothetical protein